MPLIALEGLTKRYRGGVTALDGLTLELEPGIIGLVGANGAGKSTMLKLLTGIMQPTRGSIRVAGRVSALIEVTAGFHRELTGRENVYLYGAIMGMTRQEIRQRFDAIVAFSGLEEFIDTPFKRYSSGMCARLGFSVAAHVDPDVLLVDEVLSVGDYLFQQKCLERMQAVMTSGTTVVFVSHNLRELATLCHRSLLLERGRVLTVGPTEEVIATYFRRGQQSRVLEEGKGVGIALAAVTLHDGSSARVEFQTGEKLYLTVEARAQARHQDMSVVIQIVDDHQYPVFDTCTQRLDAGPLAVEGGEGLSCTFELDLSLAEGTYHVNAFLHRYVESRPYDRWLCAATFFVRGTPEIRGIANLHPRLVACQIGPAAGSPIDGGVVRDDVRP